MNSLLPLAFALILINHKKIKDDQNYRFSVLSIIGITYFFILRFVDYYFSIFNHQDHWHIVVRLSVVLITVGICLSPWMTKSTGLKAGISILLFIATIVAAFGLERPIKVAITEAGGYFAEPPLTITSNYSGESAQYFNEAGGYSLLIPEHWEHKIHDSGLDYFVILKNGIALAELRPQCFHKTGIVAVDVVKNLTNITSAGDIRTESHCFKKSKHHVCLVKNIYEAFSSPLERWHWLAMDPVTQQNIDIDILFYQDDVVTKDEVYFVLSSLKIKPPSEPAPACISPMDWF